MFLFSVDQKNVFLLIIEKIFCWLMFYVILNTTKYRKHYPSKQMVFRIVIRIIRLCNPMTPYSMIDLNRFKNIYIVESWVVLWNRDSKSIIMILPQCMFLVVLFLWFIKRLSFLINLPKFKTTTVIHNLHSIVRESIVRESPSKVGRWTLKILRGRLQLGVAIDDDSLICGTGRERERDRKLKERRSVNWRK